MVSTGNFRFLQEPVTSNQGLCSTFININSFKNPMAYSERACNFPLNVFPYKFKAFHAISMMGYTILTIDSEDLSRD